MLILVAASVLTYPGERD